MHRKKMLTSGIKRLSFVCFVFLYLTETKWFRNVGLFVIRTIFLKKGKKRKKKKIIVTFDASKPDCFRMSKLRQKKQKQVLACLRKPKKSISDQDSNHDTWRKRSEICMIFVCVCMCSYKYVAICSRDCCWSALYSVETLSHPEGGAIYIHSGVLDGAKNLSLRAGTNSQCIVGDPSGVWNEHAQTRRGFHVWVIVGCSFKPKLWGECCFFLANSFESPQLNWSM